MSLVTDYANPALLFQLNGFQSVRSNGLVPNEFYITDALLKILKFTSSAAELQQPAAGPATVRQADSPVK